MFVQRRGMVWRWIRLDWLLFIMLLGIFIFPYGVATIDASGYIITTVAIDCYLQCVINIGNVLKAGNDISALRGTRYHDLVLFT